MRTFFCVLAFAASLMASGELSGRRAPGFSLTDVNNKPYDPQDYRGKILLLEIGKTNCQHCANFVPILEEIVSKYQGRVAALTIVNPPDNSETIRQFIAVHKVSVPVLLDMGQVTISYFKATPDKPDINVPHLFIIDAQGMIQNDYPYNPLTRGIFEGRDLFSELNHMLGKSK